VKIKIAYKTELDLNDKQITVCMKHAGAARYAYNWGLSRRIKAYKEEGKSLNAISLHRELNELKKTELSWMYKVSKCAPQEALRDLDKAYINFFKGLSDYPCFKSKKKGIGSFRLTGTIRVFENTIQLPRLGLLRLKEKGYLPKEAHINSATVSEYAGRWYVSVQVEEEIEPQPNTGDAVGIDLGLSTLAMVSDGTAFKNPRSLIRNEKKLKRTQKEVSRKNKRSNNRRKAVRRLQRIHAHIKNIRKDAIHKVTTELAITKSEIVVEDWNASRNLKLLAASSSESINACQSREVHVDA